ncbi:voltage-gated potassium channel [Clostridium pascui]|uniref:potassium channel family protein n=1 Tax=Clostridium pascui TaxID=46609 RepID=UPI001FAE7A8C|nr:potassium channel family protein [Clostridium pascui]MBM7870125.1 voltage-gated potassium channel [Clostridium pascui]
MDSSMKIMNKLKNKNIILLYEVIMTILTIIAIVIVVLNYFTQQKSYEVYVFNIIDTVILVVFALDYFIRLILSQNKLHFFKNNIIDLISIIPFNYLFQTARILRIIKFIKLSKLTKLTSLFRALVLIRKFKKNMDKFLQTNNFNYVLWISIFTVIIGALGFSIIENKSFLDGLWWSFVTVTTVGYGDMSPKTGGGKVLASIIMLIGIGVIGMLTGTISTFFINKKVSSKSLKVNTIESIKRSLDDFDNLSNEDIDNIYKLLKSLK